MTNSHQHLRELMSIETDDCTLWDRSLHRSGYPVVYVVKRFWYGNRLACTIAHGEPTDPKLEASHTCGQPACVNPRHLRWETRRQNEARKENHSTRQRGEACYQSLPHSLMVEVVARYRAGGVTQQALADEYGIGQNTVSRWVRGVRADAVKLRVAS